MSASKGLLVLGVVLTIGVFGSFVEPDETADPGQPLREGSRVSTTPRAPRAAVEAEPDRRRPVPRTFVVTRVVDGDTLELGSGEVVRIVGIDTPEVGECGAEKAAAQLSSLTLGERVVLRRSDEDRDRYGRLLRYVDVGGVDAGLRLIESGLAVARYDSRDGYGFHPREPRYVVADDASPDLRCAGPRPIAAVPGPGPADSCAPGYRPCLPPFPPDVDCGEVDGPIAVTGADPHGLDADGDGVACE